MMLGLDWLSWIGVVGLVCLLCMLGYGIRRFLGWNKYCRAVDAMQRGDIDTLTVAPPPRSLYDFYIDRITQGFILNQYEKITHRWLGYRDGIGRVRAAEEIAGLEHEKEKSRISADTDEENLRGSRVLSPAKKCAKTNGEKVNQYHRHKIGYGLSLLSTAGKKCLFFCIFLAAGSVSCGTVPQELSL
jgi:hypothetical protein